MAKARRKLIGRKCLVAASRGVGSEPDETTGSATLQARLKQKARELNEALEQQAATAEVLRTISGSTFDLQAVLDTLVKTAVQLCAADAGHIALPEGQDYRTAAVAAMSPQMETMVRAQSYRPGRGTAVGRALAERRVVQIADIGADREHAARQAAAAGFIRTILAVPLLRQGKPIGAFGLARSRVAPFTKRQIELVRTFADQAVIAIENTRLLSEVRESLDQQTATADVLRVISSSTGALEPVFLSILDNATRICQANFGTLFLREGEALRVAAHHGSLTKAWDEQWRVGMLLQPDRDLQAFQTLSGGQPLQVVDLSKAPSYLARNPKAVNSVETGGIRTMVTVPMLKDGETIGVITIFRTEVREFTEKQTALVTNFAAQAVIAIENTRLLNELRQRTTDLAESLEQQMATSEVLKVISSSPGELEPVFQSMLENATRICEAKFGTLYRFEDGKFHLAAQFGSTPELLEAQRQRGSFTPTRGTLLDRLVQTKKLSHSADATTEPGRSLPSRIGGARSTVAVPMIKDGELVGAFAIYRQEVRPFTDKQIELLSNFAAQAVIAIENTRLLSELRQSLEQQTATADVLRVISSSPGELEPVFRAMLENATRICEAKFGTLALCDGDALRAVALHGGREDYADERGRNPVFRPAPNVPVMRAIRSKQVQHVADMLTEQAYIDRDAAIVTMVETGGARTFLAVPMLKDNEAVGVIIVYRQEVRPFTEEQIALVQNFAAQAVIAIENTRLLNELRQRTDDLSNSLARQTATSEVLGVISRSKFELRPILQSVVDTAARLCRAERAVIFRLEGGAYRFAAGHSLDPAYLEIERQSRISPGQGSVVGRAAMTRQVARIDDAWTDPLYDAKENARVGGVRSMIGVPLMREGKSIGVIALARIGVEPFREREIELVTTFADQAVIAIENVRLFDDVQKRTQELSKSLEDLHTAQDRLVQTEKLASLGQLTAGIAHEIKNPLNFVNNFSSLSVELIDELQEELGKVKISEEARAGIAELAGTLKGNLDKIAQHGKRADAIVKNMLLHSREGSGEHRPVEVNALVEESLNLAYHGARAEKQGFNIVLERSFDAAAGEVDLYPQEVTRVLLNIIANGFYAAHKRKVQADGADFEPTLVASTKNLGDRVEIRIRDNGIGIPPEVKEKMFNPFFTTKPAGEGTGLGLSISHDIIVKQHAGAIAVDTQPGQFTEFTIVLPRNAASSGRPA